MACPMGHLLMHLTCAHWPCSCQIPDAPCPSYDGLLLDLHKFMTLCIWQNPNYKEFFWLHSHNTSHNQALRLYHVPVGTRDILFEWPIPCWKRHCHACHLLGWTLRNNICKRWTKQHWSGKRVKLWWCYNSNLSSSLRELWGLNGFPDIPQIEEKDLVFLCTLNQPIVRNGPEREL